MQTLTGSCDVVCMERSSSAMKWRGRIRLAATAHASAMTVNAIRRAVVRASSVEPLSSSEIRTMGHNSPNMPTAIT